MTLFAGGGTGGHLYPALALADALMARRPDVRPFFVGACRGVEARVLPQRGVEHALLPVEPLDRRRPWRNWRVVPGLARALRQVAALFRRLQPALVVVTGGYAGAVPGAWAAVKGVPLALHEQNTYPGFTTRLLCRWARQVHLGFPEAAEYLPRGAQAGVRVSGNPVRPLRPMDRAEARARFGLAEDATVMLVVGGSQGSAAINGILADAVERAQAGELERPAHLQVLWATGHAHREAMEARVRRAAAGSWVRPVGYIDDISSALTAADFALSRAGAMATSEFLAWGVPAILVPLPGAAANHQEKNARALEAAGAAVRLSQRGLDAYGLWRAVRALAADRARRLRMAQCARTRARPDAAAEIAEKLAELLPGTGAAVDVSRKDGEQ